MWTWFYQVHRETSDRFQDTDLLVRLRCRVRWRRASPDVAASLHTYHPYLGTPVGQPGRSRTNRPARSSCSASWPRAERWRRYSPSHIGGPRSPRRGPAGRRVRRCPGDGRSSPRGGCPAGLAATAMVGLGSRAAALRAAVRPPLHDLDHAPNTTQPHEGFVGLSSVTKICLAHAASTAAATFALLGATIPVPALAEGSALAPPVTTGALFNDPTKGIERQQAIPNYLTARAPKTRRAWPNALSSGRTRRGMVSTTTNSFCSPRRPALPPPRCETSSCSLPAT